MKLASQWYIDILEKVIGPDIFVMELLLDKFQLLHSNIKLLNHPLTPALSICFALSHSLEPVWKLCLVHDQLIMKFFVYFFSSQTFLRILYYKLHFPQPWISTLYSPSSQQHTLHQILMLFCWPGPFDWPNVEKKGNQLLDSWCITGTSQQGVQVKLLSLIRTLKLQ